MGSEKYCKQISDKGSLLYGLPMQTTSSSSIIKQSSVIGITFARRPLKGTEKKKKSQEHPDHISQSGLGFECVVEESNQIWRKSGLYRMFKIVNNTILAPGVVLSDLLTE